MISVGSSFHCGLLLSLAAACCLLLVNVINWTNFEQQQQQQKIDARIENFVIFEIKNENKNEKHSL